MIELAAPFRFVDPIVEDRRVRLRYATGDGTTFEEVVTFPFDLPDSEPVRRAVRVLHLAAGVSYYKCLGPVPLAIDSLTTAERALVEGLYDQGLREFAYRNGFRVPLPVEFVGTAVAQAAPVPDASGSGAIVPIGGGKDSALVASLVPDAALLAVNPVGAQEHLAEALGRPLLAVTRTLDPLLRTLVEQGVPNGHVPVTAITSAISVLSAAALGVGDVLMGIERSADEPTVVTPDGVPVNHQFSKSREAEELLAAVFAPVGVRWFSLLRPLTELAIGAAVARRGLGPDIVSCNRVFTVWNETTASRRQRPCGDCAKCLFTALMLAPAQTPGEIAEQYGRPLLDEAGHIEATRELWSDAKPFDCVGERLESAAALVLLSRDPAWRRQAVVSALAAEARDLLAAAGVDPLSFLAIGPVELLPGEYRSLIEGLGPDLAAVAESHRAA